MDAPKNMSFFNEGLFRARLTFPFSSVIVGNSIAGLKAYQVPKRKGICIYNGFNFNRITNLEIKAIVRSKFNINTAKIVGMVAGFFDRKDYETYLKTALLILKERTDVSFMAIGEGPKA